PSYRDDTALFRRATVAAPGASRAWTGLSYARRIVGDTRGALDAARRAVALAPTEPWPRVTLAYAHVASDETALALADLARANRLASGAPLRGYDRALRCARAVGTARDSCVRGGAPLR
ncbi:MAG: hypothetical protein WCJ30_26755, partial [Deltaproteobacteria bacterium]